MNDSLSKLEERFCEYKYNPKSNNNYNNIENNQINQINNNNDNNEQINDNNNQNEDNGHIADLLNNLRTNIINLLLRIDNRGINDEERLILLEEPSASKDILLLFSSNSLPSKFPLSFSLF